MRYNWFRLFWTICLLLPLTTVNAQEEQPTGAVYIVQAGDTLSGIANQFGVSITDLINANQLTDPNSIKAGDQLLIPGLEGISGVLNTQTVPFGENVRSLSLRYRLPEALLARLNHLTSPAEIYAGAGLIIPEADTPPAVNDRTALWETGSLLELAILNDVNPWEILSANNITSSHSLIPGAVFWLPGESEDGPGALPSGINALELPDFIQGKTGLIRLSGEFDLSPAGSFMDHPLNFYPQGTGEYTALQGVHAMAQPGIYPLSIQGNLPNGAHFAFSQMVPVFAGDFLYDAPLIVDPATIDPEVTRPEDAQWTALALPVSAEKLWDGVFLAPVDAVFAECWPSRYGSRRAYNNSDYIYFHTGLDFCGGVGDNVYAPAPGSVVFAGPLSVRGNAIMIDHGHGIYTGYMHLSEILVEVGESVGTGQLIGKVGGTGRVTGPHLHWEVWVGGVQVDPLDWLQQAYP